MDGTAENLLVKLIWAEGEEEIVFCSGIKGISTEWTFLSGPEDVKRKMFRIRERKGYFCLCSEGGDGDGSRCAA